MLTLELYFSSCILKLSALPSAGAAFWARDDQPRDRELRLLMHHGLSTAGSKPWCLMHEGQIALSVHLPYHSAR